jgi:hypothetical protein
VTYAPKSRAIDRTASKAKTGADVLVLGNVGKVVTKGDMVFFYPAVAPTYGGALRKKRALQKVGVLLGTIAIGKSRRVVSFSRLGPSGSFSKRLKWERLKTARTDLPAQKLIVREPSNLSPASVIDKQAFEPDARSRALLRGRKIAEADLRASGGAYDLADVRMLMQGVSRQRIDKQVREGSLLAVPGPSNRRHYPTVQFQADGTVVKGLKAVREALPTQNPWAVLNFLVQPDDRLNGRKPIELLKAGDVDEVVDAARSMGQQGG